MIKESPFQTQPTVLYTSRLKTNKMDEQFKKLMNIFKQLHINIPIVEALSQMPKYAKFLKDLHTNNRKLEEVDMITLNGICSTIINYNLPKKLRDLGSFMIPCLLGNGLKDYALVDSGASINVMPYTIYMKLGLGELIPIRMTL